MSLLDFIVQQAVLLDGECLKFVNDLEIVHSASNCESNYNWLTVNDYQDVWEWALFKSRVVVN